MPNVFEMYVASGNRAGFWVQRQTWGNSCALVKLVGGRDAGELPGAPPYFNDPEVTVDMFNLHNGALLEADVPLRCPGTYSYSEVDPPGWYNE
jgi:hypothetical protein